MFREQTVFILGAGASWHYSCPTGEELVKLVSQKAQELRTFLLGPARIAHVPQLVSDRFSNLFVSDPAYSSVWRDVARECLDISDRLARSNPPVIDYFLAHNPDLRDIGRFLIAWAILECEAKHGHGRWNRNRGPQYSENYRDNWYRYLLSKLMSECPTANALRENRITFVTFNYDVSLELQIYDGLTATSFFNNEPKCIDNFFGDGRFLHVYGSVRDCPPTKLEEADLLLRSQEVLGGQDGQWISSRPNSNSVPDTFNFFIPSELRRSLIRKRAHGTKTIIEKINIATAGHGLVWTKFPDHFAITNKPANNPSNPNGIDHPPMCSRRIHGYF
jgi:hypothetical protein